MQRTVLGTQHASYFQGVFPYALSEHAPLTLPLRSRRPKRPETPKTLNLGQKQVTSQFRGGGKNIGQKHVFSTYFWPILPTPRNLLLTYFNVFGVSGLLGGPLLLWLFQLKETCSSANLVQVQLWRGGATESGYREGGPVRPSFEPHCNLQDRAVMVRHSSK